MRQAGVLAAAALVALDDFEADDHADAPRRPRPGRRLADAVGSMRALRLVRAPDTNIVLFETPGAGSDLIAALAADGVRVVPFGPTTVRATLHRDVDDDAVGRAIDALTRRYK